jgi:hypothetical protein
MRSDGLLRMVLHVCTGVYGLQSRVKGSALFFDPLFVAVPFPPTRCRSRPRQLANLFLDAALVITKREWGQRKFTQKNFGVLFYFYYLLIFMMSYVS